MNKILAVALVASVTCGCVCTRQLPPPPQPPRQIEEIKAPQPPAPVAVVPVAPKAPAIPPAVVRGHAVETVKPLRVLVSLNDGNAADKPSPCKRALQTNVEGPLARNGFRVVYAKPAEILVTGDMRAKEVNSRGSRVVWQGSVDMEITRAPEVNAITGQTMRDVVAKRRFDAKSGDARSSQDAQIALSDRMGPDVAAFVAEGVNRVGGQMKVVELLVTNAWQVQDAAGYPTFFTQKVAAMKGVYACRVTATDNAARTMRAEVIYDAAAYPDGFLNRLYTIPELNIVR